MKYNFLTWDVSKHFLDTIDCLLNFGNYNNLNKAVM